MQRHNGVEVEKGYSQGVGEWDKNGAYREETYGGTTLGEVTGRGGDTHRGLKSRHIQFLYGFRFTYTVSMSTDQYLGPLAVRLVRDFLLALEPFLRLLARLRSSWHIYP